jgi:hypothetical protein
MTDDPADRRTEDQTLAKKLDEFFRLQDEHTQLMETVPILQSDLAELSDAVLGTRVTDFHGGGRLDDGLTHDVRDIKQNVNGGGLSNADKWRLRWSMIASVLSAVAVIVAAVILAS